MAAPIPDDFVIPCIGFISVDVDMLQDDWVDLPRSRIDTSNFRQAPASVGIFYCMYISLYILCIRELPGSLRVATLATRHA